MRQLTCLSRRQFGILMGAKLSLLASNGTAQTSPVEHQVTMRRFRFDPSDLTIKAGDTVVWSNLDPAPHTATEMGSERDSGQLDKGQSYTRQFDNAGVQSYFCRYHPHMTAKITVTT